MPQTMCLYEIEGKERRIQRPPKEVLGLILNDFKKAVVLVQRRRKIRGRNRPRNVCRSPKRINEI
jgi:hypothetical protein